MPNQLAIPFKKHFPVSIRQAVRDYIHAHSSDHPEAFKWDINRWESLRKDGVGGVVHVNRIDTAINYHTQLVFILTKMPADINLEISYAHAFSPASTPITMRSLAFERAAVLFNLAALYSQLASSEDRSSQDGVKRASAFYQNAAGTLSFLVSSALPKLVFASDKEDLPRDLSESFVKSMEYLMLAQAQECVWQRAVMDHYKNGLIAKLAAKVSSLYAVSLTTIHAAAPPITRDFPSDWISQIETKQSHFAAAAQYRKSIDDLEANRYGLELARLFQAEITAKKGYNMARRGGVQSAVLQDIKSLLDAVQKNLTRAERDNDLIYHQDVPASSALPPIQEVSMVQSNTPPQLQDPKSAVGDEGILFGEMLGWGAREAINIYNDNKQTLVKEKISDAAQEMNDEAEDILAALNLPSSLEALEKPVGLPPSLLKKAEEVRLEQGPESIEASLDDVHRLAHHDMAILNEAMDILDNEASEDEAARKETLVSRIPSHQANRELVQKQQRYRDVLTQAAESDELVRQKWDEWETNIVALTWDEGDLEALVPSNAGRATSVSAQTQKFARTLRVLLESLDELFRARKELVERAQRLADGDNVRSKILKAASNFERWVDVQPVMFEDVSDEELAKYDRFIQGLAESQKKQEEILDSLRVNNEHFVQSRKEDPSIKEREQALRSLDLAYHKYREISRNLEEGMKFYNNLTGILLQFKEACKLWSNARSKEIRSLSHSLQTLSISAEEKEATTPPPAVSEAPSARAGKKPAISLPPLNSSEWETMNLPASPPRFSKR
ncbi:hypothetical protein SERLA73DRAFT_90416 [Serpula lacrymans var. lacrymans S7.3]|uniref:BRO1 domain-containing protein n=2 Tax=Serpula lacrymans var. lacrymans TaxID=341189 RepID=F8PZ56_SERL3|nr:uncharacterized protein SERLADRAFT_449493 [Serpula lacrymans var. lacrymans S7.9]EGN99169.1 hypothetical protein SERLA73DRAFT_90416 [Serpula lacrymans var. lacrymans S7.3]EGO24737.1 hypothetical protein SERLADRAFT_449493 [Serpula lacrymans var. lacrymans S7.9]